jgi:hypothetical protein
MFAAIRADRRRSSTGRPGDQIRSGFGVDDGVFLFAGAARRLRRPCAAAGMAKEPYATSCGAACVPWRRAPGHPEGRAPTRAKAPILDLDGTLLRRRGRSALPAARRRRGHACRLRPAPGPGQPLAWGPGARVTQTHRRRPARPRSRRSRAARSDRVPGGQDVVVAACGPRSLRRGRTRRRRRPRGERRSATPAGGCRA